MSETILKAAPKKVKQLYAIYCAEAVLHIYEDEYPNDNRPRLAIEAAKEYLKNPTKENKAKAQSTTNAALDAAYAAAIVTVNAVVAIYAAAFAAYNAAFAVETADADINNTVNWAKKAAEEVHETIDFDSLKSKAENDIWMYTKTSSLKLADNIIKQNKNAVKVTRKDIFNSIEKELRHAYTKHGMEPWSRHEFYAILKEEVDEAWDEIKKDHMLDLIPEIIQIAAMCVRYLETGDRWKRDITKEMLERRK